MHTGGPFWGRVDGQTRPMLMGGSVLAHGVQAGGGESVAAFVGLGLWHMLTGWDHLLFVVGVALLAWRPRRAAGLLSLFALGHSVTLVTAVLAGWRVDPGLVDIVIADSVAVVGVIGLFGRPRRFWWVGTAVLVFGLAHGLGLATRFQALDVPADGMLSRLLAFNLGVEVGQFLLLYLLCLVGDAVVRARHWKQVERVVFGGLVTLGVALALAPP